MSGKKDMCRFADDKRERYPSLVNGSTHAIAQNRHLSFKQRLSMVSVGVLQIVMFFLLYLVNIRLYHSISGNRLISVPYWGLKLLLTLVRFLTVRQIWPC